MTAMASGITDADMNVSRALLRVAQPRVCGDPSHTRLAPATPCRNPNRTQAQSLGASLRESPTETSA